MVVNSQIESSCEILVSGPLFKVLVHSLISHSLQMFAIDGLEKKEKMHVIKIKFEIKVSTEFAVIFKESGWYSSICFNLIILLGEYWRLSRLLCTDRKKKRSEIVEDKKEKDYD